MILTLGEMVREVSDFLNRKGAQDLIEIKRRINRHFMRIARELDWQELRGYITSGLTYTANEAYIGLEGDIAQVIKVIDTSDDYELTQREIDQLVGDNVATLDLQVAPIVEFSTLGYRATKRPLSVADTLTIVGEKTTDKLMDVRVSGVRSSPEIEDQEKITTDATNSTTPVAGSVTWRAGWSVNAISIGEGFDGYIEVRETTAGTVLARVSRHRRAARYLVLHLPRVPSSANALTVVYKRNVLPLTDDDDAPPIDCSEALVDEVIADMRQREREYTQANEHRRDASRFLASTFKEQTLQGSRRVLTRPDASKFRYRPGRIWR